MLKLWKMTWWDWTQTGNVCTAACASPESSTVLWYCQVLWTHFEVTLDAGMQVCARICREKS